MTYCADDFRRPESGAEGANPEFFLILKVGRIEEIKETKTIIEGATINSEEDNESSRNRGSPNQGHMLVKELIEL